MNKKTYVDDCRCLNLNHMMKLGSILKCGWRTGSLIWTDTETGEQKSSIGYEADTSDPYNAFLRIHYTLIDRDKKIDYKIRLSRTEAHYGGWRWWFICPHTGRRVAKLYLPSGGDIFASRHAYRLAYESQSIDAYSRAQRKFDKLQNRVDQDDGYYYRRKGMHQKTFDRIMDRVDVAEELADYYWMRRMKRFLGRDWPISGNSF